MIQHLRDVGDSFVARPGNAQMGHQTQQQVVVLGTIALGAQRADFGEDTVSDRSQMGYVVDVVKQVGRPVSFEVWRETAVAVVGEFVFVAVDQHGIRLST